MPGTGAGSVKTMPAARSKIWVVPDSAAVRVTVAPLPLAAPANHGAAPFAQTLFAPHVKMLPLLMLIQNFG
jgi:hypothetical protein